MTIRSGATRILGCLGLLAGSVLLLITILAVAYRPDRPIATIEPGTSAAPAFAVQIVRPREGLPLGGLLPPQVFGLDESLGFTSSSPGAAVGTVDLDRLELRADGWDLLLVADDEGRATPETRIELELVFEERPRRVVCRPGDPAAGTLRIGELAAPGELSGSFEIELPRCDDADTGEPLGWPPKPFVLRGSFDRLPLQVAESAEDATPQSAR